MACISECFYYFEITASLYQTICELHIFFASTRVNFHTLVLGDGFSTYADVYNASSDSWTSYPSGLGLSRGFLAAASLPMGLIFFAGGVSGEAHPVQYASHSHGLHFCVILWSCINVPVSLHAS
jgi:hypothetical protein